jgi:hypothetical protein
MGRTHQEAEALTETCLPVTTPQEEAFLLITQAEQTLAKLQILLDCTLAPEGWWLQIEGNLDALQVRLDTLQQAAEVGTCK